MWRNLLFRKNLAFLFAPRFLLFSLHHTRKSHDKVRCVHVWVKDVRVGNTDDKTP